MKKIFTFVGQSQANLIIKKMQRCKTEEDLDLWFNKGMKLNNLFLIYDIYLD
jgi:hypothetical protein